LGERWHVKLAHNALDTVHAVGPVGTDREDIADRSGSDPGNDPVEVLGTRVEELHGRIDALQESAPAPTAVIEHRVLSTATAGDNDAADSREAHDGDRSTAEGGHLEDLTKAELYQQAREAEVQGALGHEQARADQGPFREGRQASRGKTLMIAGLQGTRPESNGKRKGVTVGDKTDDFKSRAKEAVG
jgi:hypothetical protein